MFLYICACVYIGILMYNLEKDEVFLCWLSFWVNVMVHFEVVVLDRCKPRIVARVSTLKRARSIAKCMAYDHLFDVVMIWRSESKYYESLKRKSDSDASGSHVVSHAGFFADDDLPF